MGKILKSLIFIIITLTLVFTISGDVLADPAGTQNDSSYSGNEADDYETVNAEVVRVNKKDQTVTVRYPRVVKSGELEDWQFVEIPISFNLFPKGLDPATLQSKDNISFNVDENGNIKGVNKEIEWTAENISRTTGFQVANGGKIWETKYVYNRLFKSYCRADQAVACWSRSVFNFSQVAILTLATAVIVFSGLIYMTSAGDPKRIALAKKLIIGALSGVAVIVLGKFFLTRVVGVPWL